MQIICHQLPRMVGHDQTYKGWVPKSVELKYFALFNPAYLRVFSRDDYTQSLITTSLLTLQQLERLQRYSL